MTEDKWLRCRDPEVLRKWVCPKASGRKLRLFAVACCRCIWQKLSDEDRARVELAERIAEGMVPEREWSEARRVARGMLQGARDWPLGVWASACWAVAKRPSEAASDSSSSAAAGEGEDWKASRHVQADLFRCIFGNPFRPVPVVHPFWLAWNDDTILKVAEAIYAERTFDRLPILGDALEEAGCTEADILNHCRQPGEHVRGCWVVDLLLGKQ